MNICSKIRLYVQFIYTKYILMNFTKNKHKKCSTKYYKNHKKNNYEYLDHEYSVFINIKRKPTNIYKIISIEKVNPLKDITYEFFKFAGPAIDFNRMKVTPSFFNWGDIIIFFYNNSKIKINKNDIIDTSLFT